MPACCVLILEYAMSLYERIERIILILCSLTCIIYLLICAPIILTFGILHHAISFIHKMGYFIQWIFTISIIVFPLIASILFASKYSKKVLTLTLLGLLCIVLYFVFPLIEIRIVNGFLIDKGFFSQNFITFLPLMIVHAIILLFYFLHNIFIKNETRQV